MKDLKETLMFFWQLPQNLIGLCVLAFHLLCMHKPVEDTKYGIMVFMCKHVGDCGVSLGDFILLDSDVYHDKNTYLHEHGHQLQSRKYGWFYLLVVGLPSAIGNLWDRFFHKNWFYLDRIDWYYNQPWERGADKLGGVTR